MYNSGFQSHEAQSMESLKDAFSSNDAEEEETHIEEEDISEEEEEISEEEEEISQRQKLKRKRVKQKGKEKVNEQELEEENEKGKEKEKMEKTNKKSLSYALPGKQANHKANIAIAKWFFDAGIPFSAINSPYFKPALKAIIGLGAEYEGPSFHDMRVSLLNECKKELDLLVKSYRSSWKNTGCTIMADSWCDQRQRTFINFLVYSPVGSVFVKSFDASDAVKDPNTLYQMFSEVVEWVDPSNVVHIVTDNASVYKLAGIKLHEKYNHIFWSPCAARCLNLILKDISSLPHVRSLISRASKITKFVYNHGAILSWLRKSDGWKEIVHPAVTRVATTFVTLQSIHDHKHNLQGLVASKFFRDHKLSDSAHGKVVSTIVLDQKFWNECMLILKVVAPIIKLLHTVDADGKPSLGYVYGGMLRTRLAIQEMFMNDKACYQPYITIIDDRWDKHLRRNIHAAAYFLNPSFLYGDDFVETPEVMKGLLDLLEIDSICNDGAEALKQVKLYRERQGTFARQLAFTSSKTLEPDEWWRFFGHGAPLLKNIAIPILSQTTSSFGCEKNQSLFERIHSKRMNKLEHKRLNDLVYVHYNLRLKYRTYYKNRSYDPMDIESSDTTDFWVIEDEDPEFHDEEVNNIINHDNSVPIIQFRCLTRL